MITNIIRGHGRLLLLCMLISLALYMTAAWHSAIYLHPDEYYQIVEFASYKMHITSAGQMAWEFGERIRPALQPLMCLSLLKAMNLLHVTDHYTQLYLLRVLSGLFSLFSVTLFCVSSLPVISEGYRRVYIVACFCFWYPYTYGVHFSSEAWSGCLVLISVSLTALYYLREKKNSILFFSMLGLFLGTAFLLRFQTAFISLGIVCWMLFEKKERLHHIAILIVMGAVVLMLGTVIDRWFYGEWLCVPWRYFDSAFIHKHTEFGSKPFYFYALMLTLMLTPPVGLLIVVSVLLFIYTQPRSLYVWSLLPFLLFHTIIGHKEFRFMYPVMSFFPLVVVLAYQGLREKRGTAIPRVLLSTAKAFVIVFNLLCIVIFVFYSDRFLFDSKIFCDSIHQLAKQKKVIVYSKDINNSPYVLPKASIPKDLFPEYIRDRNVSDVLTASLKDVGPSTTDTIKLIATSQYEYEHAGLSAGAPIVMRTLADLSFLRHIIGEDAYRGIEENTYYLIECR